MLDLAASIVFVRIYGVATGTAAGCSPVADGWAGRDTGQPSWPGFSCTAAALPLRNCLQTGSLQRRCKSPCSDGWAGRGTAPPIRSDPTRAAAAPPPPAGCR